LSMCMGNVSAGHKLPDRFGSFWAEMGKILRAFASGSSSDPDIDVVRVGSRILRIEKGGCMAHYEKDARWGKVVEIRRRLVHGVSDLQEVAFVDFGEGNGLSQVMTSNVANCRQGWPDPRERRGFVWTM
jgi:hypothetical protein